MDHQYPYIDIHTDSWTIHFLHDNGAESESLLLNVDELKGVVVKREIATQFIQNIVVPTNLNKVVLDRPTVRFIEVKNMVYLRFKTSYRQEYTIEIEDYFNEQLIFDFDKKDRILGIALLNSKWICPTVLKGLTSEWKALPFNAIQPAEDAPPSQPETPPPEVAAEPEQKTQRKRTRLRTPFLVAACDGDLAAVQSLYEEDPTVLQQVDKQGSNALILAAGFGCLEVVIWLHSKGIDLEVQRKDKSTSFLRAASHNHIKIMEWLREEYKIEKGKDMDLNIPDTSGDTPLMHAAANGCLEAVIWLAERGADVGRFSTSRSNALHRAAMGGHLSVVEWLVLHGKQDPNLATTRGFTALHYAVQSGRTEVAQWLALNGASLTLVDKRGHSAFDLAQIQQNDQLLEWFNQVSKK